MKEFRFSKGMIRAININKDESKRLEMNHIHLEIVRMRARCDINTEIHSLKQNLRQLQISIKSNKQEGPWNSSREELIQENKSRSKKPTYMMTETERKMNMRTQRTILSKDFLQKLYEESARTALLHAMDKKGYQKNFSHFTTTIKV